MTMHKRIEPAFGGMTDRAAPQSGWRQSPLIEMRSRRRRLRWANIGFGAVAFLLFAISVISILYVGPSPMPGPGAPPLVSHPAIR